MYVAQDAETSANLLDFIHILGRVHAVEAGFPARIRFIDARRGLDVANKK